MKNMKSFKDFLNQVNERYEHDEDIKLIDNPDLVDYAWNNNLSKVKELLGNRVNPDSKDINDNTALIRASLYGNLDIVKELLKHNADTNIKDNDGYTAFTVAKGKVKDYFISQGINK